MQLRSYLDILDDTKAIRILRVIWGTQRLLSGNEIAKYAEIPQATCLRQLDKLCSAGWLTVETIGRSMLYSLGPGFLIKNVLAPLFLKEADLFKKNPNRPNGLFYPGLLCPNNFWKLCAGG